MSSTIPPIIPRAPAGGDPATDLLAGVCALSQAAFRDPHGGLHRVQLLRDISKALIEASGADRVGWWLREGSGSFHCEVVASESGDLRWDLDHIDVVRPDQGVVVGTDDGLGTTQMFNGILDGRVDADPTCFTPAGSFLLGDARDGIAYRSRQTGEIRRWHPDSAREFPSVALIPVRWVDESIGFLQLRSRRKDAFSLAGVEVYEVVARILALTLTTHSVRVSLQERVKELGCLYEVVRLAERPGVALAEVLDGIARLIPAAWQYPEITAARIEVDGVSFATQGFRDAPWRQSAEIGLAGRRRGRIDVVYLEERPRSFEGPFLEEERHLIDALAREISGIIDRRQAREEMARLEDQLRHADRLATIGQLAAGVAHELNEPLAAILGFAQLAEKAEGLPAPVREDLAKIVDACLHSRTVVSKLRVFARQAPAQRAETDLNRIVNGGLFIVRPRCEEQGIAIVKELDWSLPPILADKGQLHQVLVNLAVNAVQAMPGGGRLTIRTQQAGEDVALIVEDTGVGMSREVMEKIFLPFYTTKDLDQGTGLGLSVVQGIVAAHGGTIRVESDVGRGSRFEVRLPAAGENGPPEGEAR